MAGRFVRCEAEASPGRVDGEEEGGSGVLQSAAPIRIIQHPSVRVGTSVRTWHQPATGDRADDSGDYSHRRPAEGRGE